MMRKLLLKLFLLLSVITNAQNAGDVAQNFGIHPGFIGSVNTIVTLNDGKILVGGGFKKYEGATENYIIRLLANGTKDTSFNTGTGFNNEVNKIAIQADGKILVGGYFTSYNGVTENRLIRLHPDGTKDTSFTTGTGFNFQVTTIATQVDGKILVGGDFTTYNGFIENRLIRLHTDGTKDTSFNTGAGFNNQVSTIAIQADDKIVVGGQFTSYNGATENRIIRLNSDGTEDISFNTGNGFGFHVYTIVLQAGGKILVGGNFTFYNGAIGNRIIRLHADGTNDTSFITGTGFNNQVTTIATQADGKILVGGDFTTYNGAIENRLIRLNIDGTKDTSFNTGTGFNFQIRTITTQIDGKILVCGYFTTFNGAIENRLIRLHTDSIKDTSFNNGNGKGFDNTVIAIAEQADGKILVGGSFTSYNGAIENGIIRLHADGTKDTSFNTGTGFTFWLNTIEIQADGKILVGGSFTSFNGAIENRLIRLQTDGTKDTSFNTGTGFNNQVFTIATQVDGKILVGGQFTSYNGATENRIIRLNTDGTKDTSFNTGLGFNSGVSTITIQADGKILVGGYFTSYKGVIENRIIRLNADGTKDTSFITGMGFNNQVTKIATQTDGKILVGGDFTNYNGAIENRLIRLNTDGTKDTSFNTGTGFNITVSNIATQVDGKILVGGYFTTYNEVTENRIIRLNPDGTKDTSFNTGSGFDGFVLVIAIKADGKIVFGGAFITYKDDNNSAHLISLYAITSTGTTWTGAINTIWTEEGNWSNGVPNSTINTAYIPDVINAPIIEGSLQIELQDLIIDEPAGVTINSGGVLKVNGTSTGNVTYKRNLGSTNWYLVSSPLSEENMTRMRENNSFASGTSGNRIGFAPYDDAQSLATQKWLYFTDTSTNQLVNGKGYSAKLASVGDISFTGTINSSDVSITVSTAGNGYNLLGNPYTSHINIVDFFNEANSTNVDQTIWVWNHTLNRGLGDYQSYPAQLPGLSHLAPAQGFFVRAKIDNSTITFAKTNQATVGGIFQKSSVTEVKLMMNEGTIERFTKVYYLDNVTKGFDNGYDGETFGGIENSVDIFSNLLENNEGKKYQVQSLPISEIENMIVPIGVRAAAGKEITFTVESSNLPGDVKVFLEDRLTNTFTRLDESNTSYKVTVNDALFGVGRFYLHTNTSGVLSNDTIAFENTSIYITNKNTLKAVGLPSGKVTFLMFNILGKQLLETSFNSKGVKEISLPKLSRGIYIIQLETIAGKLNKKIIIK